jgi:hypothetical protein
MADIEGTFTFPPESTPTHPMDDRTPVTISAGALYTLMLGGAIACKTFDGSKQAREDVLMALTVTIPAAKRQLVEQAGWDPYRW